MSAFPIGATVRLKSGGPVMTVVELPKSQAGAAVNAVEALIEVCWFVDGEMKTGRLPEGAIEIAVEPPPVLGFRDPDQASGGQVVGR